MARLNGIASEQMTEQQRVVADAMIRGPRGHATGLMGLWLNAPELAGRMQHVGEYLRFQAALPQKLREMTILLVARDWSCFHEWLVHAPLACRAGLSEEVIEAIRQKRRPDFEDGDEEAVYAYVSELLERRRVSAASYAAVVDRFGPPAVIELAGLVGHYVIGAATLNAVEFDLPDNTPAPF